jgi:glycerate dehydrogenase
MSKPVCVFLDRDSIDCNDLDFSSLQQATELVTLAQCTSEQIVDKAGAAEIIIVNKVIIGDAQFAALPKLKLVCVIATGTNNVDLESATRHGVVVCNVRDYAAASVSQHVFMLILALTTRFLDYQSDIRSGAWQAQTQFCLLSHPMQELKGKTLGLIGYGHIAQAVERIALAFGMQVLVGQSPRKGAGPVAGRIALDELFERSDVISLHCPLSEDTRNLVARPQFERMKRNAIIINTARGGIINEVDLLKALSEGLIAGAGIDCLVKEPPSDDDPMITSDLKNLIVTPHNAWGTLEARQRLLDGTVANIVEFGNGQTPNRVNP